MGKVLFLADRKELVKQAKDAFYKYIENTTMCNLLLNKDERNAKIIFSTYQTMLHAIDTIKNADVKCPASLDKVSRSGGDRCGKHLSKPGVSHRKIRPTPKAAPESLDASGFSGA